MTTHTISGTGTYPDSSTPLVGAWYIALAGGYVLEDGVGFSAGVEKYKTSPTDGSCSVTLPATSGDELYTAFFLSGDRRVRLPASGVYSFTLTEDKTWDDIIDTPTVPPMTPSFVAEAQEAAQEAQQWAESANAANINVGTTTTGDPGTDASVTKGGTPDAPVLDFVIPRGDKGDKGDTGDTGAKGDKGDTGATGATGEPGAAGAAATATAGTTTTLDPGDDATVENVGTTSAAVFNFGIPKGEKGDTGDTGATGAKGDKGDKGDTGPAATTIVKNAQTAAYTLALTDAGKVIEVNSSTDVDLTIPVNSSVAIPVDTVIYVCQMGAGHVTVVPGSGVTLRYASSLVTRAQYSTLLLRKRDTNEWVVTGDAE